MGVSALGGVSAPGEMPARVGGLLPGDVCSLGGVSAPGEGGGGIPACTEADTPLRTV